MTPTTAAAQEKEHEKREDCRIKSNIETTPSI